VPKCRQYLPDCAADLSVDRPTTCRSGDRGTPRSDDLLAADQNRARAQLADLPTPAAIQREYGLASNEDPHALPRRYEAPAATAERGKLALLSDPGARRSSAYDVGRPNCGC
jgi:hypothetical protein